MNLSGYTQTTFWQCVRNCRFRRRISIEMDCFMKVNRLALETANSFWLEDLHKPPKQLVYDVLVFLAY